MHADGPSHCHVPPFLDAATCSFAQTWSLNTSSTQTLTVAAVYDMQQHVEDCVYLPRRICTQLLSYTSM